MKLVCGLGNPGDRYARTRHNAGFLAVEAFADARGARWTERFQSRMSRVDVDGTDVLVLEPMTFMNLSGHALSEAARFFHIEPSDVLVVHDDVDLPLGRVTVKRGGGDGGHKGVRSSIEHLGTNEFARVRIGVGRPGDDWTLDVHDHVLAAFAADEEETLRAVLEKAAEGIVCWVVGGVPMAQNRINRRERPARAPDPETPSCPGDAVKPGPQDRKEVE